MKNTKQQRAYNRSQTPPTNNKMPLPPWMKDEYEFRLEFLRILDKHLQKHMPKRIVVPDSWREWCGD